jgi:hypothetical protein
MKRVLFMALIASGLACAKSAPSEFIDPGAITPPPPPDAGPQRSFGDSGTGIDFTGECAEETKQIYVLGTDKALYRFNPETLQFKHLGIIGCPSAAGTFSMAIDRRGTAWVEFTDGRLFAVSTFDASCKATAFQAGQTGFNTFGMGYAKNADGLGETLYASGAGLAALDTKTFELKFLGSLSFGRTELTGLDQELYAFAVGSGVVARLNKNTAATEVVYRTSAINETAAFAFAQWGGEFWIFTGNEMSKVTRYSPVSDTSSVAVENTGMLIVGAGSSTCAPTKPLK